MQGRRTWLWWLGVMVQVALVALCVTAGEAQAAKKKPTKKTGVELECSHSGATVLVNEKAVGQTPIKLLVLAPGEYTIKVKKPGFLYFTRKVKVKAGAPQKLTANLLPYSGVIFVTSNIAGATVAVDGEELGKVPLEAEVKLGKREVKVSAPGKPPVIKEIKSVPGVRTPIHVLFPGAPATPAGDSTDDLALAPIEPLPASGSGKKANATTTHYLDDLALEAPPTSASPATDDADVLALELPKLEPAPKTTTDVANPGELALAPLVALPPSQDGVPGLKTPPPPPSPPTPWFKRWYLWTGVGAAVAAAVIVPTAVVLTQPKPETVNVGIWTPGSPYIDNGATILKPR